MSQQQPAYGHSVSITVNGETRQIPPGCTVTQLIALLELAGGRVAVAVNHEVVPRSGHASRELSADDCVEVLEAVGGG